MPNTKQHNYLTRDILLALNEREGDTCVSLYMTELPSADKTNQNRILFKDLCKQAGRKLEDYRVDKNLAARLTDPLVAIADDPGFWSREDRDRGLVFFATPSTLDIFQLPIPFTAQAVVDRRFYIRPLIRHVTDHDVFKLLLLNRHEMRLFHCANGGHEEREPPGHLRSLQDFLEYHDFEKSLQFHDGGDDPAIPNFHGQGTAGDEERDNRYLAEYYKAVKNWLKDQVNSLETLYLAGDDRNYGIFHQVSTQLPCELERISDKNTRLLPNEDLIRRIGEERVRRHAGETEEALARFRRLEQLDPDKIVREPADVLRAAHNKRLDTLFLPDSDDALWGTFNEANQDVRMQEPGDKVLGEELINLAAIRGLQNNSSIVLLNPAGGKRPIFAGITIW